MNVDHPSTQRRRSAPQPARALSRAAAAVVLVFAAACSSDNDPSAPGRPSDVGVDTGERDTRADTTDDGSGGDTGGVVTTASPLTAVAGIDRQGTFVDPHGREVLLRGINVNSFAEYWQFEPEWAPTFEFTQDDADTIAGMGFNLVRLLLTWSRVEPEPGAYDDEYLAEVAAAVDLLWARGVYTLIDLHQDAWGPTLAARPDEECTEDQFPAGGWDGAPGWATLVDDETSRCIDPVGGRILRELSPAVREAWDAFLSNAEGPGAVGLQDRYAAMLGHVAEVFGPRPGVMGYDIINEPNAMFGQAQLDGLADLYTRAVAGIRDGESRAGVAPRIVVFEPTALWPNLPFGSTVAPFTDDPQVAYGPHIYQGSISPLALDEGQVTRLREEAAAYGGVPILCGEWGDSPANAEVADSYLARMIALQDREKWGMAFWVYQSACGDPHAYGTWLEGGDIGGMWGLRALTCDDEGSHLGAFRQPQYELLARPALHYAPGPIASIAWDADTGELVATGEDASPANVLVLFLPAAHADRTVSGEGLEEWASEPVHEGVRWTATAVGGPWTVRAGP